MNEDDTFRRLLKPTIHEMEDIHVQWNDGIIKARSFKELLERYDWTIDEYIRKRTDPEQRYYD